MVSRMRRAAIGLMGAYWLAMFVGTHLPISTKGMGNGGDKGLHFLAFAGLALLMSIGVGGWRPTWRTFFMVLLAALTYAGIDEFSQMLVGRHCDFWDWLADGVGTVFGLATYASICLIRKHRPQPNRRPEPEIALR